MRDSDLRKLAASKGLDTQKQYGSVCFVINGKLEYPTDAMIERVLDMPDYVAPKQEMIGAPKNAVELSPEMSQEERDKIVLSMMKGESNENN
jgi:hypothetical protein